MAALSQLSKAKTILLAVNLATDSKVSDLQYLVHTQPTILSLQLVLRMLLTFLPESSKPDLYVPLLQQLAHGGQLDDSREDVDHSSVRGLSEDEARKRVRSLHPLPLEDTTRPQSTLADPLTSFLISRARRIDAETGLLTLLPPLIVPFLDQSERLRAWFISTLLPLLRLQYEYYPSAPGIPSLADFEALSGRDGINLLLSQTEAAAQEASGETNNVGRDLRGLAGPWLSDSRAAKRRKIHTDPSSQSSLDPSRKIPGDGVAHASTTTNARSWHDVFDWLVSVSKRNFPLSVQVTEQWGGPADVDLGGYETDSGQFDEQEKQDLALEYVRVSLMAIMNAPDGSYETLDGAFRALTRVARIVDINIPLGLQASSSLVPVSELVQQIDEATDISALLHTTSQTGLSNLKIGKPLILFLHSVILSTYLLSRLGYVKTIKSITSHCLLGDRETQAQELRRILHTLAGGPKKDSNSWKGLREQLIWLMSWGHGYDDPVGAEADGRIAIHAPFGKVNRETFEREFLRSLLSTGHYKLAVELYLTGSEKLPSLPSEHVEKIVLESAMNFYDNASNCNRTRGGMKTASDIIQAFYPGQFPESVPLRRAAKLLTATHALSFYNLTLQRGVPFQPVNIRVQADPVLLLGRVLEQNPRSYTKLDDLVNIGRTLVEAGLISGSTGNVSMELSLDPEQELSTLTERRVAGMAIEAALAEDDFETAYSYVLSRMSPVLNDIADPSPSSSEDSLGMKKQKGPVDDVSWRAAFQAGRYRPATASTAVPKSNTANIRSQEMRLELLSQALILAPSAALSEILGVWRRCEEDLQALLSQEHEEDEQWDAKGDHKIPGQFVSSSPVIGRKSLGRVGTADEAPIGLFDVARGAAAALSKSAFPLHKPRSSLGHSTVAVHGGLSSSGHGTDGSDSGSLAEARTRKRDVVSNMVSGGLASGIGWVLGATPVQPEPE